MFFIEIHTSTTSSFSNAPSNFSNSSSKFTSISINSIELEGDLQPILKSFQPIFIHKNQFV